MPGLKRRRGCICCKQRYDGRPPAGEFPIGLEMNSVDDMAVGFSEFSSLHQFEQQETTGPKTLEPHMARQIASFAKARAGEAARCQSPGERQANKPLMAQFELQEIELGPLLGVGGFSKVYEIHSLDPESSRCSSSSGASSKFLQPYNKEQRIARDFLSLHALRLQDEAAAATTSITSKPAAEDTSDETLGKVEPKKEMARYALKHLRPCLMSTPEKFAKAAMDLACEAEMMLCLDHPHIVKLRGWAHGGPGAYKNGRHDAYFLIIDRLLETLEDRIWGWIKQWKEDHQGGHRSHNLVVRLLTGCLPGKKRQNNKQHSDPTSTGEDVQLVERLKVSLGITNALEYLHDKRIIYRDLKSSNIGFDIRGDVKIFDFGLSRFLPTSTGQLEESFQMSTVGTRRYTAPEVTKKKPYNLKADVYSFGVVLWEMFSLSSPKASGKNDAPLVLNPCPCWPADLQQLVAGMLMTDPKERPTVAHIRSRLMDVLMQSSDSEMSDELLNDKEFSRRRRSTFRLEMMDLEQLEGLEDDSNVQSHTSFCSSLSTYELN